MENEKQTKQMWYEEYENKTYRGISYQMFRVTPKQAEDKIFSFLDKLDYEIKNYEISIITEGSETVIIDLWIKNKFVSQKDIFSNDFLISRQKDNKGQYKYRVRNIL